MMTVVKVDELQGAGGGEEEQEEELLRYDGVS